MDMDDAYGSNTTTPNEFEEGDSFSVERLRMSLAAMIVIDKLPFSYVEREGFLRFTATVEPRFPIPDHVTVAKDCIKLYLREKEELKRMLTGRRVCLTTDRWTSLQNLDYLCLTAHFIDSDWNHQKKILNLCLVPNHKGETIGKVVESCLLEWGIDKIFTVTVDNSSSNDVTIDYLRRKGKDSEGSILSCEFLHMRSYTKILNLIVQEGLEDLSDSIDKIRNAVRYVQSSSTGSEKFKACVEKEKILCESLVCLDLPTRWNFTYMMLDRAEKFENAFERMKEDDGEYLRHFDDDDGNGIKAIGPPNHVDWEKVRAFTKLLKAFYEVILRFSGSSSVTSNAYFQELLVIQHYLRSLCDSGDDPLLREMAESMKRKYDKYWGRVDRINLILFVAVVLDPRYKFQYIKFWFKKLYDGEQADDMTAKVRDALDRLYDHYATRASSRGVNEQPSDMLHSSLSMFNAERQDSWMMLYEQHLAEENSIEGKSELDHYLLDGNEPIVENFDILSWWKVSSSKYPILGQIAQDVLPIPVSTVASEFAFSIGDRVLDYFESSPSPKVIEALICAQNWLMCSPINLQQALNDLESYQIDSELASEMEYMEPTALDEVESYHDSEFASECSSISMDCMEQPIAFDA